MHVTRSWPLEQAEELDDAGALAGEIRAALERVLTILEEPPLPAGPVALDRIGAPRPAG
jgi:hypothetical protein